MKKQLLSFVALLCIVASSQAHEHKKGAKITGHINLKIPDAVMELKKKILPGNETELLATAPADASGNFSFDFLLQEAGYYTLELKAPNARTGMIIFYDNNSDNIIATVDTLYRKGKDGEAIIYRMRVTGSPDNELVDQYYDISRNYYTNYIVPTQTKIEALIGASSSSSELDSLNALLKKYKEERVMKMNSFIKEKMLNSVGIYQTISQWDNTNFGFMDSVLSVFEANKKNSFITSHVADKIASIKKSSLIGRKANLPVLKDVNGKEVNLSDYIGKKAILLDFWASWCGPCIKEFPAYKKLYENYKDKDFVLLSVSIDSKPDMWVGASKRLGVNWPNFIDEKAVGLAKFYSIQEIPTNFLIDKNGVIVKKNVSMVEVIEYLK